MSPSGQLPGRQPGSSNEQHLGFIVPNLACVNATEELYER